ncbi:hypothetical protein, partial [Bacillus cereus]|uniref:hypothetical protein n=1 Tax=Bacillus cereus TaxID=1396 RepID=UPI001C9D9CFD
LYFFWVMNSCFQTKNTSIEFAYLYANSGGVFSCTTIRVHFTKTVWLLKMKKRPVGRQGVSRKVERL